MRLITASLTEERLPSAKPRICGPSEIWVKMSKVATPYALLGQIFDNITDGLVMCRVYVAVCDP
ncbi:MAG TPA: hypothetical protein DC047_00030 [Blastocatellia bacterium]|nr:hypothetical protein [Blastocatellia bacterium]